MSSHIFSWNIVKHCEFMIVCHFCNSFWLHESYNGSSKLSLKFRTLGNGFLNNYIRLNTPRRIYIKYMIENTFLILVSNDSTKVLLIYPDNQQSQTCLSGLDLLLFRDYTQKGFFGYSKALRYTFFGGWKNSRPYCTYYWLLSDSLADCLTLLNHGTWHVFSS